MANTHVVWSCLDSYLAPCKGGEISPSYHAATAVVHSRKHNLELSPLTMLAIPTDAFASRLQHLETTQKKKEEHRDQGTKTPHPRYESKLLNPALLRMISSVATEYFGASRTNRIFVSKKHTFRWLGLPVPRQKKCMEEQRVYTSTICRGVRCRPALDMTGGICRAAGPAPTPPHGYDYLLSLIHI